MFNSTVVTTRRHICRNNDLDTISDHASYNNESLEAQRQLVEWEKQQKHQEYMRQMAEEGELSLEDRVVAIKLLVHEAHRRDAKIHGLDNVRYWNRIADEALVDCEIEGPGNVQKNLSCMCIFTPQLKIYLRYGENCNERMSRVMAQHKILRQIADARDKGSDSLFVSSSSPAAEQRAN